MTSHELPMIRNPQIAPLIRPDYTAAQLAELTAFLHERNVLHFPPLGTGLFSAALVTSENEVTGYKSAWVRDNVHILNAHLENGDRLTAERGAIAICRFFHRYRRRIETILKNPKVADDETNRPHIRFDGETLTEIDTPWAHAQNDAIGYFLWLWAARCQMADSTRNSNHEQCARNSSRERSERSERSDRFGVEYALSGHSVRSLRDLSAFPAAVPVESWEKETIALLLQYLHVIQFWQDEDSGHWEEERKISASSIGVVVAAMKRLVTLEHVFTPSEIELCYQLLIRGQKALNDILPCECIQPELGKQRLFDAALLFLIYPLEVTSDQQAAQIAANVLQYLLGPHGIKRYLGDSFYCTDYESHFPVERLTSDFSMSMDERDVFFRDGGEAQWAIFDPILSVYFGRMYRKTGTPVFRQMQCRHLNRSLGQITGPQDRYGPFHCPELYYCQNGIIQTSRSTPLLWTQANLLLALNELKNALSY